MNDGDRRALSSPGRELDPALSPFDELKRADDACRQHRDDMIGCHATCDPTIMPDPGGNGGQGNIEDGMGLPASELELGLLPADPGGRGGRGTVEDDLDLNFGLEDL